MFDNNYDNLLFCGKKKSKYYNRFVKNRQLRTTCRYFCRRAIKNRNGLACHPDKTEVDHLCSCLHGTIIPGID